MGQNSKPLSNKAIELMKPRDSDKADVGENRGLRVTCGSTGKKTFFYRYRSPTTKKLVQMSLGVYPEMSLERARIRLRELKLIRHQDRCPATEARDTQAKEIQQLKIENESRNFTVRDLIELYLTQYIEDRRREDGGIVPGARKPKGQDEVRRTLYGDAVRVLGDMVAADVSRQNIIDMIMKIVARGANVQAGAVLREFLAAYEYSMGIGKFDDSFINPVLQAKTSLKRTKLKLTSEKGRRVFDDGELKELLRWLPGSTYTEVQKNVIKFTLWTGCRTGEVCNAAWKDIDLDKGIFRIKETKTGVERDVQLSSQALIFLRDLKSVTGEFLFPSQRTRKPIQQKQLTEKAWRMRGEGTMIDLAPWTPHDLRRSVRTGLSRLQCPRDVAEAILGHAAKGIEGTYNLHQYSEESRHWLQVWADHLDQLIKS
jgi:integrase